MYILIPVSEKAMLIKSLSWTKATANTIALVLQYYYNLFPFFS